ncbi:hypothetical protein H696_03081 [Fonticula alba]|uniref:Sphingomyelin phosphodiesterase 4 n=1 Tax=Fonticula alba TaxID=691883 RepID=A0A058Z8X9_FONAL|nr:hypothetical protein H696_03081 [Fonticula alba]KCV70730.1 hypothetical protein H696_03081 [Fonticula alba]|eukprot:XP_009495246.1 hypothetical protein H696_03081 [Fonticula alba]
MKTLEALLQYNTTDFTSELGAYLQRLLNRSEDASDFQRFLPRLLGTLFGTESRRALLDHALSPSETHGLLLLLLPSGPLFRVILSQHLNSAGGLGGSALSSDPDAPPSGQQHISHSGAALYEIHTDKLPYSVRQEISHTGSTRGFFRMFHTPGQNRVHLNIFQFFIYYLLYHAILPRHSPYGAGYGQSSGFQQYPYQYQQPQQQMPQQPYRQAPQTGGALSSVVDRMMFQAAEVRERLESYMDFSSGWTGGAKPPGVPAIPGMSGTPTSNVSQIYYTLIREYLAFMLPVAGSVEASRANIHSIQEFRSHPGEVQHMVEFFLGSLTELWVGQNTLRDPVHTALAAGPISRPGVAFALDFAGDAAARLPATTRSTAAAPALGTDQLTLPPPRDFIVPTPLLAQLLPLFVLHTTNFYHARVAQLGTLHIPEETWLSAAWLRTGELIGSCFAIRAVARNYGRMAAPTGPTGLGAPGMGLHHGTFAGTMAGRGAGSFSALGPGHGLGLSSTGGVVSPSIEANAAAVDRIFQQLFSVWISLLRPWRYTAPAASAAGSDTVTQQQQQQQQHQQPQQLSPIWYNYVFRHLALYTRIARDFLASQSLNHLIATPPMHTAAAAAAPGSDPQRLAIWAHELGSDLALQRAITQAEVATVQRAWQLHHEQLRLRAGHALTPAVARGDPGALDTDETIRLVVPFYTAERQPAVEHLRSMLHAILRAGEARGLVTRRPAVLPGRRRLGGLAAGLSAADPAAGSGTASGAMAAAATPAMSATTAPQGPAEADQRRHEYIVEAEYQLRTLFAGLAPPDPEEEARAGAPAGMPGSGGLGAGPFDQLALLQQAQQQAQQQARPPAVYATADPATGQIPSWAMERARLGKLKFSNRDVVGGAVPSLSRTLAGTSTEPLPANFAPWADPGVALEAPATGSATISYCHPGHAVTRPGLAGVIPPTAGLMAGFGQLLDVARKAPAGGLILVATIAGQPVWAPSPEPAVGEHPVLVFVLEFLAAWLGYWLRWLLEGTGYSPRVHLRPLARPLRLALAMVVATLVLYLSFGMLAGVWRFLTDNLLGMPPQYQAYSAGGQYQHHRAGHTFGGQRQYGQEFRPRPGNV